MDPLQELLETDHRRVFDFFLLGLRDVSEPTVDRNELLYNASVLAHYAQVSTQTTLEWPSPSNLSEVFDHFVANTDLQHDGEMMEIAGTQCLLLAGFFEDQMRRRHSIQWYATLGAGFFIHAAALERSLRFRHSGRQHGDPSRCPHRHHRWKIASRNWEGICDP